MNKGLPVLLTMTILTGVVLSSSIVSADNDSVVDEINITVPVSCTISGTGQNTHNANINNGLYEDDMGTTTLHAFCNDNEGFAIYAAGYTGNEVGGTNSNKLVGTNASNNATIESGTATTAGNPDISNWAMKLQITQDSGDTSGTNAFTIDSAPNVLNGADASFSSYHTVPNEYTKVAHKDSNTDMTANTGGVKLTTTYAAYISKTQPADTYSGQVIYTLVHPVVAPTPGPKSLNNAVTMQDVTYCADNLAVEQVYTLTDIRDNQNYKVARLADGKCWMLENLNINGGTALSFEDTDFDSDYELPTTGRWSVSDGKLILPASAIKNAENSDLTDETQFGSTSDAYVFNSGNKVNCGEYGQYRIPCYSYYSYGAATLGSGGSFSICPKGWRLPLSGGQSNYGWKNGDYYALATAYGADLENNYSSTWGDSSFYDNAGPGTIPGFIMAGGYIGKRNGTTDGEYDGGAVGSYWSSEGMAFEFLTMHVVVANGTPYGNTGLSVRCLVADS